MTQIPGKIMIRKPRKCKYSTRDTVRRVVYLNGKQVRFWTINPRHDPVIYQIMKEQSLLPKFRLSRAAIASLNKELIEGIAFTLKISKRKMNSLLKTNPENSLLTLLSVISIISDFTRLHYDQIAIISFTIHTGNQDDKG